MGRKMGVKIRQAGVMSMKVPMINSRILMINRITYLLSLIPSMASDTALGIDVYKRQYPTSTWQNIDGKNYLFNDNGYMRTGWIKTVNGNWYYLNPTGEIRYEDLTENNTTYYFDSNGFCTNPDNESSIESDYQSILDQERRKNASGQID